MDFYEDKDAWILDPIWSKRYTPIKDKYKEISWHLPSLGEPREREYGIKEEGLTYDYLDRFHLWYSEDQRNFAAWVANYLVERYSIRWYEIWISILHRKQIEIVHIHQTRSAGFTYTAIGWREINER